MRLLAASAPEFATPRVVARTTGVFFIAGGVAAAVVGLGFEGDSVAAAVVRAVAGVAWLTGAAVLRWGRHLSRRMFHVLVGAGTCLITLVVTVAPSPGSAVALAAIFVFVSVDAFFFFAGPEALVHLAVMMVAQAAALSLRPDVGVEVAVGLSVLWVTTSAVVGGVVQVASSAVVDALTGLANRRRWDEALEAELGGVDRRSGPVSVALVDVDHFKQVNDEHGHVAGDDLLRSLAHDWSATLPDDVLLARRGGDEFAVLLPGRSGAEALAVVEAMQVAGEYQSVSCGVAEYLPGETRGDLLRRADVALYTAKASGRGRAVLSGEEQDSLVRDLAEALANDTLDVAFQPILALPGVDAIGVEALARWEHPRRGPVSPAEFVPAAEANGLIGDLGAAVLRTACRGALLLEGRWGREILLAVNVSGRELTSPRYADRLLATLDETGWPADRLVVEVTESLLEGSTSSALATLDALRRHGIGVAIDDFGTGFSTFSRLDVLPADFLKLDHSFIAPITVSARRAAMLRALLDLSRDLGLRVIAEGVETQAQADLLSEIGCPFVQGYLFGRPAPAERCALPASRTGLRARGAGA